MVWRAEQKYPNLCAACRDPFRCSESDEYSGYEGTLRCITQGIGQVAWTSYETVRRAFNVSSLISSVSSLLE